MKTFNDFKNILNEKNDDVNKLELDDYLDQIKDALINDFNDTEEQADEYIDLYLSKFTDAYKNKYTPREAIASTQIPGVKITNKKILESNFIDIDIEYEQINEKIDNINNYNNILECKKLLNKYYNKYKSKPYSDIRIFERIKNNHNNLTKKLKNKMNND